MEIAVLGAGMVGRAIALDLAGTNEVTCFDLNPASLHELRKRNKSIQTVTVNLAQYENFGPWLAPYDFVVIAVPGYIGFRTLEAVIRTGKDVVDISFFPEDAMKLDALAKEMGVTVITDCGVAPGMSNLILGRYHAEMKVDAFECYVGGLPKEKKPPFQYKAPFSPIDVIQEYLRPARMVENGKPVIKPALSDRELIGFPGIGVLEAFNTDGLRSLVHTMKDVPEMKEKTLRDPGHIDLIVALQQAGFFDSTTIRVNQTEVSPLDFTSRLLLKEWKLEPEEAEFTIMKVVVKGKNKTITWNLYDEYDPLTHTTSMARTTGYTCTAAVNLVKEGLFTEKGVFPPEFIGADEACFDFVMQYLKSRKVNWKMTEE